MRADFHFGGAIKSHFSEKQLKRKLIKAIRNPEFYEIMNILV
jgi:hypothetical protein